MRCTITTLDQLKLTPAPRPAVGPTSAMPAPVARAARYTSAVARWIAAGKPKRTQEEIDHLFTICQACEHFSQKVSACRLCGCRINRNHRALGNKLAMATESCPIKKW